MNNLRYDLNKSFQEVFYRIDNWINEGSCWIIETEYVWVWVCKYWVLKADYVNISVCSPQSGSTYIELPYEWKISMKGLIDIITMTVNSFCGAILDI